MTIQHRKSGIYLAAEAPLRHKGAHQ